MGRSLGLALYLGFSALADGLARRRLARRQAAGKEDPARLNERFGVAACPRPAGPLAWFHAASVGEALSLIALIRRLTEARPDLSVLVTTGTTSSAAVFADRAPPRTLHHYVPVDTATAVRGFLDHWRPDLAVWTESEFWPRLMHETHRRGIPMLLINARMSETSFRRWRRARGMARSLLRRFDLVLAQEAATEAFLTRLGLPGDRIETIGTLKEGAAPLPCNEAERVRLAAQLGTRPAWLAASTHPGEEEACAAAHGRALPGARRLVLILAPRHPERGSQIAADLRAAGWVVARRAADEPLTPQTQIYVADTLGEMGLWFRLAPVSFVGGSLVPIGGHNPYEPAALGSAILHGPNVRNFADIYARLGAAGGARLVRSSAALGDAVAELTPDRAAAMARAAWAVSTAGAEVTERTLAALLDRLPDPAGPPG
ncbi:MAG TPA: 3-deoxy-D-manno-octulosonic acid transferase [Rhodobacteraceae bacterium]|jgi:3-deoxy-D-manno-octulosonic-acid transferase|nr:3-deoxy-D-manno-octulosonic acid transferase [Paracoccaceae bacterium]HBG98827.1 3-deoxy-D-manno-octulosonic acid transferase [Paracoccaceae bacterium]